MTYSDKVQAELAKAQQTAIANKILDMMQELQLNNNETTACRWIWELIQNAKDVVNDTGKVNIAIDYNEEKEYLLFEHDGKCFTTQNMVHLISQVSSKDREQAESDRITGKFGTGFLTTHLLSEKVWVDAFLKDEGETVKKIDVLLDRSGKTKEAVISAVQKSFEQLEESKEVEQSIVDQKNGFYTRFLYTLEGRSVQVAREGLNSLYVAIPYLFAFLEQINSIRINDLLYFERDVDSVYEDMIIHTIKIKSNEREKIYRVLKCHNGKVDIAIPVLYKDGTLVIREYPAKIPKLFCDFPLVGTEDFSFPVIINSSYFNPNEPRNGIYLTDKDDTIVIENKELICQAVEAYKKVLDYAAINRWKRVYNIVTIPEQIEKEWLSKKWLEENIIEKCKEHIKQAEIIDTQSAERKALFDWLDEQEILIISDQEKMTREQVWNLSRYVYPERIVPFSEMHNWYSSLWSECRNFSLNMLISKVEQLGSNEALEKRLHNINTKKWLNDLYAVIAAQNNKDDYQLAKIYPNQAGNFCAIQDLYLDGGIEEIYKEVLELLDCKCKTYLLDKEIVLPNNVYITIYDYTQLFSDILEGLGVESLGYRQALAKLLVIYDNETENDDEQIELIRLIDTMFGEEIPDGCRVKKVNADVMEKVKNFWCRELADEVSACGTMKRLSDRLTLMPGHNVSAWMKEFVEYLGKYKRKNLFDRKTKPILPNQNGVFIVTETLFLDSGDIDDLFKDILLETGNDIRSILLPTDIYFELPDSRTKELKDVAKEVIDYVRKNQGMEKNQNRTVQRYFNKLFLWIKDNQEKAETYFKEIVENKHLLYNDEEIATNMKKAEKYDDLMKKYNIEDTNDLESVLKSYSRKNNDEDKEEIEISEELLIQYGISSAEDFSRAQELNVFKDNFVHISEGDESKFAYVKSILQRSKYAIFKYLSTLKEYDLSNPIEVSNTIYIIKKNGKELVLITRPSDYEQVILYYGLEKDVLDFEKDYELWVEDGKTEPQQITFGKMLKLTGINKIPLRKVK